MSVDVYNLAPTLKLLLLALVLLVLPLAWVWWRQPKASFQQRMHALTWVTLFLTFDLVMFGAFTRLTDSGLGCPDWPGCYGHASPMGASAAIQDAQTQMPTGPVTFTKAWIEMIHRYLAMLVGGLILLSALYAWVRRWRGDAHSRVLLPTLTLVWVCVQGAFGALTVTMKLFPLIVTLHLMGGLTLLCLLVLQIQRQGINEKRQRLNDERQRLNDDPLHTPQVRTLHWWLVLVGGVLLVMQVALGGWVSTNYAVLACNTFPQCQGSWWPAMDFARGFGLWRELGVDVQGEVLSFQALTAIHYSHRLFAYAVFVYLGGLAWWLRGVSAWQQPVKLLLLLLVLQLITGLSNVVLDWPLLAAVLHTGGAAALCAVLVWMLAGVRRFSIAPDAPAP